MTFVQLYNIRFLTNLACSSQTLCPLSLSNLSISFNLCFHIMTRPWPQPAPNRLHRCEFPHEEHTPGSTGWLRSQLGVNYHALIMRSNAKQCEAMRMIKTSNRQTSSQNPHTKVYSCRMWLRPEYNRSSASQLWDFDSIDAKMISIFPLQQPRLSWIYLI